MQKRAVVYFDGSNLYYKLKACGITNTMDFNYQNFALWLTKGKTLMTMRYYVGVVRSQKKDQKGQLLRKNQQKLFSFLENKNIIIKPGILMENGGVYHEKGVDVKIAIDLLVGAYENFFDVAYLVSSDTDLIPAIQKVKSLGKRVEYVGFSDFPSFAMKKNASHFRLLKKTNYKILQNKNNQSK